MLKEIQKLTQQIVDFLSDKEGFSTELKKAGVHLIVTQPDGTQTSYDGYELLLYTLAVRELGSDIQLNINTSEGKKIFAINTDASVDMKNAVSELNATFEDFKHDTIHGVFVSSQVQGSQMPYSVLTMYKNGTWMRYDLTIAELLYAIVHGYKLELIDSCFVYKRLRELNEQVLKEISENE